ncbi:hypothetical protein P8C59_006914 [Phyllachora maydis]|uniref:Biogenesis of lysosome-related organelles complex 1 subunit 1 n=1 Tax=Phyllachora maydis TaxID=1825666 RepID=A0AAD9I958_9PEZI|nr:hypothetical protein P8C59_006914 [Phyllachora maydis]
MRVALDEHETQTADASGVSNELKPGVTIDLSRKNIQKLPDEVVDIIKHDLERLALSHNYLQGFPTRFTECVSLRYLNVRQNKIREFPLPLCNLRSLEILDLGRNKLRMLPPDIVKLSSLKVFALQKNQISELPLCLADMPSLQMLKLDGNPIRFPPPEILQIQASSPPNEGFLMESEVTEVTVTAHIKKILRQKAAAMNGRAEVDLSVEESHEGMETPRPPPAQIKRVISGRFPIKVNGTDVPDMRSPNIAVARPPPIPSRSHYRGLSQQATATRRPGVMPLTIGSVNERTRSNSETVLQSGKGERSERSESRFRRMGIVSRKPSELGTLDEGQANNRFSHYRGLSHGSAMQGNGAGGSVNSPASPADPGFQRPVYVRRLSILPEKRPESKMLDPLLEAAKGILYSIFQLHPMIQMLLSLTNDGTNKRSSLEIVFYNTNAHVEELELELQKYDPVDEDVAIRENENVHRACLTLVHAYSHVCSLLASNVDLFIDTGDPRYIRTLLTQLYNSIMELRLNGALRNAQAQRREEHILQSWRLLIVKCTHSIQQSEMLKNKLSSIKLKEPGIRTQSSFWTLCNGFIDAWYELINKMKDFVKVVQIPMDTRPRLRPIQQSMKETTMEAKLVASRSWKSILMTSKRLMASKKRREPSAASAPAGASTATSATGPVGIPAPQAHHAANPPGALGHGRATTNPGTSSSSGAPLSSASLPGPSSVQHVTEARAAVVASIGNLVDRELQGRATMLHGNAAAIARQEGEVARATEALRRENDKLSKVVNDAARKVKEAGNVQNWAEVLERDFLVLEETLRLWESGG